jgi:hypothetical protein
VGCDVGVTKEKGLISGSERQVNKETERSDIGGTPEDDPVGESERQVDKETVGCDVGVTKEDDLVGGSERQVDKETVTSHPTVSLSTCLSDPPTRSSSLVTPTSQVNKETERSDIGGTQGEGLVCGIEKQDDRMTERCGGLQSEVRTVYSMLYLLLPIFFMLEFGMILTMSSLKYQQISLCFGHWYSLADCWVS